MTYSIKLYVKWTISKVGYITTVHARYLEHPITRTSHNSNSFWIPIEPSLILSHKNHSITRTPDNSNYFLIPSRFELSGVYCNLIITVGKYNVKWTFDLTERSKFRRIPRHKYFRGIYLETILKYQKLITW